MAKFANATQPKAKHGVGIRSNFFVSVQPRAKRLSRSLPLHKTKYVLLG